MSDAIIDMQSIPERSGLYEHQSVMIHGAPYRILMDGLDCYIYEMAPDGNSLKFLCKCAGAELTERLAIGLLRAAALQREAEKRR